MNLENTDSHKRRNVKTINNQYIMAKCWNVRLKRTINPTIGLVEGITVLVVTQQNNHNYPDLRKALLNAGYNVNNSGGWESDSWWDWM